MAEDLREPPVVLTVAPALAQVAVLGAVVMALRELDQVAPEERTSQNWRLAFDRILHQNLRDLAEDTRKEATVLAEAIRSGLSTEPPEIQ